MPAALVMMVALAGVPSSSGRAQMARILVLDVEGESLSKDESGALRDRLAAEVAHKKSLEVISSEDMRRVLDVEAQKQAAGCAGHSDCLAEIGAALGADGVLYASVAKLGGRYVVNLSLVDPRDARSAGRDTFQADDLAQVSDEIPHAAARLFGASPAVAKPSSSSGTPVVLITGGVIAGVGAVAGAGFGLATFLAADTVANPNASGPDKAAALAQGPLELDAALVGAGVLALGAVITVVGLIVE